MGKLVKPVGPTIIICGSAFYNPDQYHNHQTPRSVRQSPHTMPPDGGPRHGGLVRRGNRRPIEQTPKRERIGK